MITSVSLINLFWWTFPNHFYPFFLLRTYAFAFPFYFGFVCRRSRSLFYDDLFVGSQVGKSGIASKSIFDLLLFDLFFHDFFKRIVTPVNWCISAGCWLFCLSFRHCLVRLIMFFNPILPVSFSFLQLLNWVVRTVIARTWHLFTQKFSVFMIISFLAMTLLSVTVLDLFDVFFWGFL